MATKKTTKNPTATAKVTTTTTGRVSGKATSKSNVPKADTPHPLASELLADATEQTASADMLARIMDAANQLRIAKDSSAKLEERKKKADAEAKRLAEEVLPQLMDEAQVSFLGMEDGAKLERIEAVFASISKDNAEAACQWLEKNGYGAIVKNGFSIPVDKGDNKLAAKVRVLLTKAKLHFEESYGVHPQTLGAFVRESLAEGRKLPKEITYHVQPQVVIKPPKKVAVKPAQKAPDPYVPF